ncbi:hypothetical protein ISCGN_015118 [Ixodes scapularis]
MRRVANSLFPPASAPPLCRLLGAEQMSQRLPMFAEYGFVFSEPPCKRAVGRGITPPTCVEPRSASPKENNSGSAQSNCEAEPAVSPTEDPLKDEVADRLCALFWPEVELWLRLCKERPVSKHSGAGKLHGRSGREAPGLEGVLTVGPKLLENRHVGGYHDAGPPGIPPGRSWSDGSSLPPLSSEGSRSSSNLPASSTSSRQGTSSGSSVSRLPPIGSLSLGSLCLEGRRMSVTSRPPTRSARGSHLPKH